MNTYLYNGLMPVNLYMHSVMQRLHFCAIVAKKNEYDASKTVPAGHLAHIDFWPVAGLESGSCVWKIPMPKITLFFTGIPVFVTAVLIGVLDF